MSGFQPGRRLRVRPALSLWLLPAFLAALGAVVLAYGPLSWAALFLAAATWVSYYLARDLVEVGADGVLRHRRLWGSDTVDLTGLAKVVARTRGPARSAPASGRPRGVIAADLTDRSGRHARVEAVVGEPQPAFAAILHFARLPGATADMSERSAAFLDAGAVGRLPD